MCLVQAVTRWRECARQTSHRVNVNLTAEIKFVLNVSQSVYVTGDQGMIDFITCRTGAIEVEGDVHTTAGKTVTDNPSDDHFGNCQFLTETQVDVQVAVINRLDFHRHSKIFTTCRAAPESSH